MFLSFPWSGFYPIRLRVSFPLRRQLFGQKCAYSNGIQRVSGTYRFLQFLPWFFFLYLAFFSVYLAYLSGRADGFCRLACLSPYYLVFIFYAFTFIRLGGANVTYICRNLTDQFSVWPLDCYESFLYLKCNAIWGGNFDRVRIPDRQNQVYSGNLCPITGPHKLELLYPTLANTFNVV